ncbi:MAG TPA: hypothetical protein V6D47_17075, partial [Oscillatoriaceae cyanobacterium]
MNRLFPTSASDSSTPASRETAAAQYTVARFAEVLGRDARTLRDALAGREPDGHGMVSGNVAKTYLISSLPDKYRLALEALARTRGYDSAERLLTRETTPWSHAVPIAQIHPVEIQRAKKRAGALARWVAALCEGSATVAEIQSQAIEAHVGALGYGLSAPAIDGIMRRAVQRDGGRHEFDRWELYLPENPRRVSATPEESDVSEFDQVDEYLSSIDGMNPTTADRSWAWTAMCENLQQMVEAGANAHRARRRLIRHVFTVAPWLSSSRESLAKSFAPKWERFCAGERFLEDRRPKKSGNHKAVSLTEEDEKKLIALSMNGGLAHAWRELLRRGELSAEVCQTFITNPHSKSYVPARVRTLLTPKIESLQDIHHGPRRARLRGAYITRDWSDVLVGDWYQSDDCTLPVYFWDIGPDGAPRAVRGQFLPMIDLKSMRILAFALHPENNYTARVIRGLILKTHDIFGLPRVGLYFENGIWKCSKL